MKTIQFRPFLQITFVAAAVFLSSCSQKLIGPDAPNNPVANFDHLWGEYDKMYGAFEPKKIDWQAVYQKYRPQVSDNMTDAELLNVMTQMLDVLDDNHVYLRPTANTKLPWYSGGILGRTRVEDYNGEVVKTYLSETKMYGNDLEYGKLTPTVGYLLLKGFENNSSYYPKAMDEVLTYLKDLKGVVIDLRANGGGEDRVSQYIANRFATEKHLSFTARLRNGPHHADFGPELRFYTEPEGSFQYTKPVVVLTNRSSYSSAETFMLAMLQNKTVTQVGDVTGGAFSDAVERDLPNGWSFRVPIADVRDANGKNLEGIGITPKIVVRNKPEDLKAGHDYALETAIGLLN
ncbi:S41 family peptidase [Larkinella knui]|uniref:Peptidase S41 n=1 Tax=Larkinella knui TaxID=2025310 RepID=A0A3P1CW91_9BACT|nr:S41 family peptidase [Larkinella knui]RRB17458.1 peptidase S41 [Larkinella knui]